MENDRRTEKLKTDELILFKKVIDILNNFGIDCWLDQGSLLGAVREGAFLPWDHDIDMGVWADDIAKHRKNLIKELRRNGINVDYFPYMIITHHSHKGIKNIPVHLKFYFRDNVHAYAEFRTIENLNKPCEVSKKIIMKFINKGRSIGFVLNDYIKENHPLSPLIKSVYGLNLAANLFFVRCREPLKNRLVVFRVNSDFFKKFKEINIYGINVKIPDNAEEYLNFKFGHDWMTPKQNWVWWQDDGALFKVEFKKKINPLTVKKT